MENKTISQKELNERSYVSRRKKEQIQINLPIGTKEIIMELTGEKPSTFCSKVVQEYIKKLSEVGE